MTTTQDIRDLFAYCSPYFIQVGQGLRFQGGNDYVYLDLGAGKCWQSPKTCINGISICFWAKINSKAVIVTTRKNTNAEGFTIRRVNGQMFFQIFTIGKKYQASQFLGDSEWNHICMVWSTENSLYKTSYYKYGILRDTSPAAGQNAAGVTVQGGHKIALGPEVTEPPIQTYQGNFVLDEFAFWNDHALTNQEIWTLYNSY